jgi:hypothetical protein
MRSKLKRFLAVIGVAGLLALPAAPALAEDPVTIPSGQNIVDGPNLLGSRKGEVQDAIQKLLKDHKYNLYVVTAKTFENPADPRAWAQAVATQKGMGKADVILTMSDDGKYYFSPNSASAIYSKTSNITQNAIVPNLAGGKRDFAQAAIDTAAAVGDAAGGGSGTVPSGDGAGSAVLAARVRTCSTATAASRPPRPARAPEPRVPNSTRLPACRSKNCAARAARC